jgi:hypothetical protein
MKKLKILQKVDKINNEETPKKLKAFKSLRYIISIIIIMLSCITLLSSCFIGFRHGGREHGRRDVIIERHDNGNHNDRGEHRDRH